MSLWRWTLRSSFNSLALISLVSFGGLLALCALPMRAARADDPSTISSGPTSAAEAKILWQDGKNAFDHGMDEDAIPRLERFIARYPGYPEYFEARHVLAQAYLRQNQPAQAKPELKAFIQSQGKSEESIRARNELCRADLELKLYSEALLTADEVIKLTAKSAHPDLRIQALILRAHAEMGLGQDKHAEDSLASALKTLPASAPAPLAGETHEAALAFKLRQCARFPSGEKLEEAQVRDQLGRRGSCLLESLNLFKNVLTTGDLSSSNQSQERISQAYASYWEKCVHPPGPPRIRPKDRDARQLKTYFRELAVVLEEDCRQKIHQGIDLINGWKSGGSTSPQLLQLPMMDDTLKKAAADLEKLK